MKNSLESRRRFVYLFVICEVCDCIVEIMSHGDQIFDVCMEEVEKKEGSVRIYLKLLFGFVVAPRIFLK